MKENRQLKIEEPCHMHWAELDGAGPRRFCGECALHVVDGSAMSRSAAEKLVEESEERVCMRMEVDGQGRPVHAPETAVAGRVLSGIAWTVASGLLVSCVDDGAKAPADAGTELLTQPGAEVKTTDPPMERPREIMGDVCYPEEQPEGGSEVQDKEVAEMGKVQLQKPEIVGRMVMLPIGEARAPVPAHDPVEPD